MAFSRKSARKSVAAAGAAIAAASTAAPVNAEVIYSGPLNVSPTVERTNTVDSLSFIVGEELFPFADTGFAFELLAGAAKSPGVEYRLNNSTADFGGFRDPIGDAELFFSNSVFAQGDEIGGAGFGSLSVISEIFSDRGSVEPLLEFGDSGFFGFSFTRSEPFDGLAAGTNFGWIQLASDTSPNTARVVDFAYETDVGVSIIAGDTGFAAVPLPATSVLLLGGLVGLAGIGARRRKRGA